MSIKILLYFNNSVYVVDFEKYNLLHIILRSSPKPKYLCSKTKKEKFFSESVLKILFTTKKWDRTIIFPSERKSFR